MVSGRATFELLPPEIKEHILLFLDSRSLFSASSVSKTWYRAISPVTSLWRRACQTVSLQIREGIDSMLCRALFVRLSLRLRTIRESRCFRIRTFSDIYGEQVTAIYYNNGKLATRSRYGIIRLWECFTFTCIWTSERHSSWVTSIKFDDHVIMASYSDGSVASWNNLTGLVEKIYINPCIYAATVDYLTDANLVVSAYTSIVGWNMSSGTLILAEDLNGKSATKVVVKPYPDGEVSGYPTVRKMVIASIVEDHLMVWLATSTVESLDSMNVTMRTLTAFWRGAPQRRLLSTVANLADELYFDGKFLYFARRTVGECRGIVCQWDVVNKRVATEFYFVRDILCLVGVGEKYIMIITTDKGKDQLEIMDRQSSRIAISSQILRYAGQYLHAGNDIFCLGRRSWLDGFDGDNDNGAVFIFVVFPNRVDVLEWSERNDQRYLRRYYPHCAVSNPYR